MSDGTDTGDESDRPDFQRYLRAKQTVDDRALDRRLVDLLREALAERAGMDQQDGGGQDDEPLRILEVGAGIGTMVERFHEWDVFPPGRIEYTALDIEAANVETLRTELADWAAGTGSVSATGTGEQILLDGPRRRIEVEPVVAEAVEYAANEGEYDLLVGAALLDILPLSGLETLLGALAPGGLYYFPITFDGATRFRPAHPADRAVERRYHEHMDRKPGGNSRAGGAALARLRELDGVSLLGVAGSDWIVRPQGGEYPGDEAAFLRHILGTVEEAVGQVAGPGFGDALDEWLAVRRRQVDAGELVYLTHQLDFLGRVDRPRRADEG